jgi:hypothetical protein
MAGQRPWSKYETGIPQRDDRIPFLDTHASDITQRNKTATWQQLCQGVLVEGKSLRVDSVNGSDEDGMRGVWGLPFKTITAAKNAAVAGDTIFVGPGVYNEHNLMKAGISYEFAHGAKITWTQPGYLSTSSTSMLVGAGVKTLTVDANAGFVVGEQCVINIPPLSIDPETGGLDYLAIFMIGDVVSYSGTTLIVNVTGFQGGGNTRSDWIVFGEAYGIFDDRAPGAAGDFSVSGELEFTFVSSNPITVGARGAVVITNANTTLRYQGYRGFVGAPIGLSNSMFSCFHILRCKVAYIDVVEASDLGGTWSDLNQAPDFETFTPSCGGSFFWGAGDTFVNCQRAVTNSNYTIWCDDVDHSSSNFYYKGQLLRCQHFNTLYVSGNNVNYRVWIDVLEINSGDATPVSLLSNGAPCKVYLNAQKISGDTAVSAFGVTLWLTCQKVSAGTTCVSIGGSLNSADVHLTVQQYEDTSGHALAFDISMASASSVFIHGGYAKNGTSSLNVLKCLVSGGALVKAMDLIMETLSTQGSSFPVIATSGSGLTLKNCTILSPVATPSIGGTATVKFIGGNSTAQRAAAGTITQVPAASLIVDANIGP